MTLRVCSPRHGSPLSCFVLVTFSGRTFSTAMARRNETARPSSSLSSAFSAKSDKASLARKQAESFSFTLLQEASLVCVRRTYGEGCVVVGQWGQSLTGIAGYTKQRYLVFVSAFLLRDTARKPNRNYTIHTCIYQLVVVIVILIDQFRVLSSKALCTTLLCICLSVCEWLTNCTCNLCLSRISTGCPARMLSVNQLMDNRWTHLCSVWESSHCLTSSLLLFSDTTCVTLWLNRERGAHRINNWVCCQAT